MKANYFHVVRNDEQVYIYSLQIFLSVLSDDFLKNKKMREDN